MRIVGAWLQEFVTLDGDLERLRETLVGAGIEVAELTPVEPDDFALQIEITANRPDLLCHYGLARELAALTGADLVAPNLGDDPGLGGDFPITIESDRCGRYVGLVLEGVTVGPSPEWLQERLERLGLRPISNIVDVTNYVLFELNQPLHAFDLERVKERIVARTARAGETIDLLDGSTKKLVEDDLVIADASGPVALAGVMGGASSSVTAGTRRILLEAAWFQPSSVRRTARRHGLATDSSYRFERGADPEALATAIRRAASLILQCAGGRVVGGLVEARGRLPERAPIRFRPERVARLVGCAIPGAIDLLAKLGCVVTGSESSDAGAVAAATVAVPSWRGDLEREIDLVEEVVRLHGYDRIPSTLPALPGRSRDFDAGLAAGVLPAGLDAGAAAEDFRWMRRRISDTLREQGYDACVHFSFAAPEFGELALANPIHAEYSTLRATLLPSLLASARLRLHRAGWKRSLLYELDKTFHRDKDGRPIESWTLGGIASGVVEDRRHDGRAADAVTPEHLLGVLRALERALGVTLEFTAGETSRVHHAGLFADPATIRHRGNACGTCGEVAPGGVHDDDLGTVYGFEIDLAALWRSLAPARRPAASRSLPRFPASTRDLAFLVDEQLVVGEVLAAAGEASPTTVESISLFDLFSFKGKGRKSVGIRLVLRAPDRTLTEAEIAAAVDAVVQRVTADCQATLRTQ